MPNLLIVVDMQNDFIDGSLGTKEAQAIVQNVVKKISQYKSEGNPIIFTQDTHGPDYLNTQEGRKLPIEHCIKGTKGWEICDEVKAAADFDNCKKYEKVTFGSNKYAMDLAHGAYQDITGVELVGLCTDICVISNAILTKTFLPETRVVVDASCCAGVTPQSHENALEAMKMCQIEIAAHNV